MPALVLITIVTSLYEFLMIAGGSVCYREQPLELAFRGIANAGFEYVELPSIPNLTEHVTPDMGREGIYKVRKLLNEYGLSMVSFSGYINLLVKSPQDTKIAMEALRRRMELAFEFGCKYFNTGPMDI